MWMAGLDLVFAQMTPSQAPASLITHGSAFPMSPTTTTRHTCHTFLLPGLLSLLVSVVRN